MSPFAGGGWVAGSQPMSTAVHMEPKINFGDLFNLCWGGIVESCGEMCHKIVE